MEKYSKKSKYNFSSLNLILIYVQRIFYIQRIFVVSFEILLLFSIGDIGEIIDPIFWTQILKIYFSKWWEMFLKVSFPDIWNRINSFQDKF